MKPYHFYLAFNPLFNEDSAWKTQAHQFHHELREKKKIDPDAFMYWGKLQISAFSDSLKMEPFEKVVSQNKEKGHSSHIYITDYQHMWVGKVEEVLKEIPDTENTLGFYKGKTVEVWFKVTDFDLVCNNAMDTLAYLSQIDVDNEHYGYKIRGMSPFTSGIRFPMIVEDKTQSNYFATGPRILNENPLLDTQGESMKLNNLLQSFVIPEENFKKIPEKIRSQIIDAEMLLVEAQAGEKKDRKKLEQAILTYLKCLEVLLNETFVAYLRREEGHRIWLYSDCSTMKFMRSATDKDKSSLFRLKESTEIIGLSQIKMLIDTPSYFPHTSLEHVFRGRRSFWEYCRYELRATLKNESLIELRNALNTSEDLKVHDRELLLVRNILLGVGGRGIINNIIESWFEESEKKNQAA